MANKPAERNTQAIQNLIDSADAIIADMRFMRALGDHNQELAAQHERNKPKPPPRHTKPDKMHLYVNNKHKLTIDADKAHEVAATYMEQGDSVWLSRKVVTL